MKNKAKQIKLTAKEKEQFNDCRGHCKICMDEGGCRLEKKLKNGNLACFYTE